jgi:hypothetical protein
MTLRRTPRPGGGRRLREAKAPPPLRPEMPAFAGMTERV